MLLSCFAILPKLGDRTTNPCGKSDDDDDVVPSCTAAPPLNLPTYCVIRAGKKIPYLIWNSVYLISSSSYAPRSTCTQYTRTKGNISIRALHLISRGWCTYFTYLILSFLFLWLFYFIFLVIPLGLSIRISNNPDAMARICVYDTVKWHRKKKRKFYFSTDDER